MNAQMKMRRAAAFLAIGAVWAVPALGGCPVMHADLTNALVSSVAPNVTNGGLDFNMWATIVDVDGSVCAVTKTGDPASITDIWLGSRVISAQKANTANAFSISNGLSLSTANIYSAVQPGGSLYGLQHSNPVDTKIAYLGSSANFGTSVDPMQKKRIGGVNVFGGGLALYDADGVKVGALGVSGDTSCADHNVAWRVRQALGLDHVPAGVVGGTDNIDYLADGEAPNGFKHPQCGFNEVCVNEAITGQPNGAGVVCP
ncbi:MAG: heme-binding protein [Rhodocyclaceae bacterium]|nr:heme-binding protein [Rhodocyclaceae bacterium]